MSSDGFAWLAEARAVWARDWRSELRLRHALMTFATFAIGSLVVVSLALGPVGTGERGAEVLPVILWIVLLFAATSGLPRTFVAEEERGTAAALRLTATPSALFAGKLAYNLTLFLALEALIIPLFLALTQARVARPGLLLFTLLAGAVGLAAASTLLAALVAPARNQASLFAVTAFPVLIPLLVVVIALTRASMADYSEPGLPTQLLLYDATVIVAGLMLFPTLWRA